MIISSRYSVDIPPVDVLSYLFENSLPKTDIPTYISADDPTKQIKKQELETLVRKLGKGLIEIGRIQQGDVVLVCTENSIWYPVLLLGTIAAGGIFTGANPAYTATELTLQLRTSSAKFVFTTVEKLPLVLEAIKVVGIPMDSVFLIEDRKFGIHNGLRCLDDLLQNGEHQWERMNDLKTVSERTAVLNFSSGTSGPPKACMLTHHNLVANAEQSMHLDRVARLRNSDSTYATLDVHCAYAPLYHASMLFSARNVQNGCSVTNHTFSGFGLIPLLDAIQRFRITYLLVVPPVAVLLIKSPLPPKYDLSSVKFLLCGAAPLGRDTSLQLEKVFPGKDVRTRQGWGMTEATCSVTLFAPDESDPTHSGVGYLVPNMQAKVVDDNGRAVGYGKEGEALIRGPNIFKGYYHNNTATTDAWTEDGWLKTGDYVVVQPSGLFSVVDRKKELIKVKGFQVSPSELEAHLLECDDVKDCAVIRVERSGQEHPQAHIVAHREGVTEASIMKFMDGRLSAHKKLSGGVVFVQAIPKLPSGKILRRLLKDPHSKDPVGRSRL